MPLSLISRIFVHAKNNFNQIKENFLDFQRRNNASWVYLSIYWLQPAFLSSARYLSLSSGKGNQIFHFVSFWFDFITVISIIVEFWILIFTLLHVLRITVWEFSKGVVLLFLLLLFSGSVDTIVFYKTGNHLPQHLWFSRSFFTVDGCIDCVEEILNS